VDHARDDLRGECKIRFLLVRTGTAADLASLTFEILEALFGVHDLFDVVEVAVVCRVDGEDGRDARQERCTGVAPRS
jgi:hypothetical protein